MHLKVAVPDRVLSPQILSAALETATRANESLLRSGAKIPAIRSAIRQGVRWRPEPPGTGEELALAPVVVGRGWGDCDDLAPWLAAELRATGRDPGARAIAVRSGPRRWHAVVQGSDGRIHDPSQWAGMRSRQHTLSGDSGIDPLADRGRRALAVIPRPGGGWSARVDLPSRRHPIHVCACAHEGDPRAALIRAAQGAAHAAPSEAAALDQIVSGLCGSAEDDGEQMGFLGDLARSAMSAVSAIPGVGPVAQQILRTVTPVARAAAPAAAAVAPWVSTVSPAAGIGLQALPLVQSLLETLTAGGRGQGPVAAYAPTLPASSILPGQPAYALPLPGLPGASVSYGVAPGQATPVVARW